MFKDYIIALGSNLGDRQKNINSAMFIIGERVGNIIVSSSFYETEPLYHESNRDEKQEKYINCVILVSSLFSAQKVLSILLQIETELGRKRSENIKKWAARLIDLDIIACGNEIINSEQLKLPHPRMHERLFVLLPLLEVAPNWKHPVLNKTTKELLDSFRTGT